MNSIPVYICKEFQDQVCVSQSKVSSSVVHTALSYIYIYCSVIALTLIIILYHNTKKNHTIGSLCCS